MRYTFKDTSEFYDIEVERSSDKLSISYIDQVLEIVEENHSNVSFILHIGERVIKGFAVRDKDRVFVHALGRNWVFDDITSQSAAAGSSRIGGAVADSVEAPMPGSIIKLLVSEGDSVKQNQPLVIVEAMKMENEVLAPADAIIEKILVSAGQQVGAGETLITFVQPQKDEEKVSSK